MGFVILYTILFSIVTVISILLTGSRAFISGGELTPLKILQMLLDWHFIIGAGFAFAARLFFIMINNSLLKIPDLAGSSTTITMFITSIAMVFVIIANYFFLGERINFSQGVGAFVILTGIMLITR
jgi:drug/metabolite transporter (DMT)-like permease